MHKCIKQGYATFYRENCISPLLFWNLIHTMKHLYAPWRGTYIANKKKSGCPFCTAQASTHDAEHYVLKRYDHTLVLLNLYPYNPGHLLIVPSEHKAALHDFTPAVRTELIEITTKAVTILEHALQATGVNVGMNLGDKASGGSIPEHLHIHVVPRWQGDTNFMPVIAHTKQLSVDLNTVFETLKKEFAAEH